MSDQVRTLLLRLSEDVAHVDLDPVGARRRGDLRRRRSRLAAVAVVVILALITVGTAQALSRVTSPPPATPAPPDGRQGVATGPWPTELVVDPSTNTLYVIDQDESTVTMVDTATCNASRRSGCGRLPAHATQVTPFSMALDSSRHTLYVTNWHGGLYLLDTLRCNASNPTGCPGTPSAAVGQDALLVAVDEASRALYVASFDNNASGFQWDSPDMYGPAGPAGHVYMLDTASCDALDPTCGRLDLGPIAGQLLGMAIDPSGHNVYVATEDKSGAVALWVAGGPRCLPGASSGCAQPHQVLRLGTLDPNEGPRRVGLVVDPSNHSLYATVYRTGVVDVLDTASCHADVVHCSGPVASVAVGAGPVALGLDPRGGRAFVADSDQAAVASFGTKTCSAVDGSSCAANAIRLPPRETPAQALQPAGIAVDVAHRTLYVSEAAASRVVALQLP